MLARAVLLPLVSRRLKHVWCPPAAALLTASTGSGAPRRLHDTSIFFHRCLYIQKSLGCGEGNQTTIARTQGGQAYFHADARARCGRSTVVESSVDDATDWCSAPQPYPVVSVGFSDECDRGTSLVSFFIVPHQHSRDTEKRPSMLSSSTDCLGIIEVPPAST